jgi:hypothetical protein
LHHGFDGHHGRFFVGPVVPYPYYYGYPYYHGSYWCPGYGAYCY